MDWYLPSQGFVLQTLVALSDPVQLANLQLRVRWVAPWQDLEQLDHEPHGSYKLSSKRDKTLM